MCLDNELSLGCADGQISSKEAIKKCGGLGGGWYAAMSASISVEVESGAAWCCASISPTSDTSAWLRFPSNWKLT